MRKGQEKLLEKARICNLNEQQIQMLSNENISLKELTAAYDYFRSMQRTLLTTEQVINEWNEVTTLMKQRKYSNLQWLENTLLYTGYPNYTLTSRQKRAVLRLVKKLENSQVRRSCINAYAEGLVYNLPGWHLLQPLKAILRCESDNVQYSEEELFWQVFYIKSDYRKMLEHDTLRDDYIHNKENSLLYMLLIENRGIIDSQIKEIANLYDTEKQQFRYEIKELLKLSGSKSDTYDIDKGKLRKLLRKNNPVACQIYEYCKNNMIQLQDNVFFMQIIDSDIKEKLQKATQEFSPIEAKCNLKTVSVNFGNKGFIGITLKSYTKIKSRVNNNNEFIIQPASSCCNPEEIIITQDNLLFSKNKKGKLYPLTLKTLRNNLSKDVVKDILFIVTSCSNNMFVKDVLKDIEKVCLIPTSYNEILKFHNRAEFIKTKYKTASEVHIKWNKINLNLAYMILASLPYVRKDERSTNILLAQREEALVDNIVGNILKSDKVVAFLANIMCKRSGVNSEDYWQAARDYVIMCKLNNTCPNIDVRIPEEMINRHDEMSLYMHERLTKKVKVPKKSVFLPLRKILPPEFEWIKTRKRLILETSMQRHCVWSYADYITQDKSAIYSYVDESGKYGHDGKPNRYTIEFKVDKKGGFRIQQVQGKSNKAHTTEIRAYIQGIIDTNKILG